MSDAFPIIIMAKAPVPGFAKTRLIPALGAQRAAALAERLLDNAVENALAAKLGMVDLCCAPDTHHSAFLRYTKHSGLELSNQAEGDLGARMARAFDRWLSRQGRALLIGTDAPALNAEMLCQAAQALKQHDAVFVPALDGGYALVGLSRSAPQLFNDMKWSTSDVMACTRERLEASRLHYLELPAIPDIDEQADLIHLPHAWLA